MVSHIPNMVSPVCHFFWHFQLTLHVQLMFHLGQPLVSEARKSYTHLLLPCWQVCQLAHNAMVPYQKQLCLGLIFLAPTSHYLSYSSGHGSHHSLIHSFLWHVQNATIPCRSRDHLPFLTVMYFFLPPFSTNFSSIPSYLILPSISWSTSLSCCSQLHI